MKLYRRDSAELDVPLPPPEHPEPNLPDFPVPHPDRPLPGSPEPQPPTPPFDPTDPDPPVPQPVLEVENALVYVLPIGGKFIRKVESLW